MRVAGSRVASCLSGRFGERGLCLDVHVVSDKFLGDNVGDSNSGD